MHTTSTIAVIVDNNEFRHALNSTLQSAGYPVLEVDSQLRGMPNTLNEVDAICLELADTYGLDRLGQLRDNDPEIPIVVITASEELATQAMREGAYDFVLAPLSSTRVQFAVGRAVERRQYLNKIHWLRTQLDHYEGEAVVPMRELERRAIERALRAANGSVTKAAKMLGIGRATLYRRLSSPEMADIRERRGNEPTIHSTMSSLSHATMAQERK